MKPRLGGDAYQVTFLNWETALHLLFVCTGNICRSPTAERLALRSGAELSIPNFAVSSAGTRAVIGHPIHADAARVLERLGGDASAFAARQLTARIAAPADLIVTMTRAHRDAVLELAPSKLHHTFMLAEVARLVSACGAVTIADLSRLRSHLVGSDVADVPDPMGHGAEAYEMAGSLIVELLPPVMALFARTSRCAGGNER
ncbi:low molecular weight phosphatase family protein [Mycolicibacterium duvalii]|uniref:Phosphotyrosine protein phosphatase I domain-containing protein n=1 Tax=Mycolicibacterium duvalii TaxID=39688 RepID=A0A7I7K1P9_9MYCO|nr:low molecular weight phosphatase family protein [Mycolicibacterium duvalii]MCV7370634.1 low molecular weight phosphatase family protein [Mycolicibacterium duvalii]PEG39930.1 low molecular weight phosphatase family protein [Mycolicibacterium duvalii]BBX17983.1 hypothetical protein MDUV_28430 [Mycolicibacterium duvalii]